MKNITVIAFDADDTLWVNEPYFQEVEHKFCLLLEDYLPAHSVSKELYAVEMQNLPLYGYGIKAFMLSMVETVLKVTNNTANPEILLKAIQYGQEMLNKPIELLDGVVDIYMPDFKYMDPAMSMKYSEAEDYPESAKAAIKEMNRQVGDLITDQRGIAMRGVLVRHLVLPEYIAGTAGVVKFIAEEISKKTYINIMDQYHPCFKAFEHPPLNRRLTQQEYADAVQTAIDAGLTRIDGITV